MENLKKYLAVHKKTVILIVALLILLFGGFSFFRNFISNQSGEVEEIDLIFDAEGPYVLLNPRRDGNALILSLKRTASYEAITYELAYTSTVDEIRVAGGREEESATGSGSIDRGVAGTIETSDKKGEYEQEILFGTCSKQVCKYDKGVENGTLTLHIKKGKKAYRMITQWHLQKPDVALGNLTSGDEHFVYKVSGDRQELSNVGFSIINDLTGVPKLPDGKKVLGKVYALNVPIAKTLPAGEVNFELAENPPNDAKLARYDESQNKWIELDAKLNGSKFTGKADGAGIFAALTPKR